MKHKEKQPIPLAVEFADMILTQSGLDNWDHCALSKLIDPFNTQSAQRGHCLLTWNCPPPPPQNPFSLLQNGRRKFAYCRTDLPVEILMPQSVP